MGMNGVYPEYAQPWLVRYNASGDGGEWEWEWGRGGRGGGKGSSFV